MLSPLLWWLVVDELLHELPTLTVRFQPQGYINDITIIVCGRFEPAVPEKIASRA